MRYRNGPRDVCSFWYCSVFSLFNILKIIITGTFVELGLILRSFRELIEMIVWHKQQAILSRIAPGATSLINHVFEGNKNWDASYNSMFAVKNYS